MKKWLNGEVVSRRKRYLIIIDSFVNSLVLSVILYYCLTSCNSGLVEFLNSIKSSDFGLQFTLIMFPVVFIITLCVSLPERLSTSDSSINNKDLKVTKRKRK